MSGSKARPIKMVPRVFRLHRCSSGYPSYSIAGGVAETRR